MIKREKKSNKKWLLKSFQGKLFITYLILIVTSVSVVGCISYYKTDNALRSELKKKSLQNLIQVSAGVDRLYFDLNRMALVINSDQEVLEILKNPSEENSLGAIEEYKRMQNVIRRVASFLTSIDGFTIFTLDSRDFSLGNKSVIKGYKYKEKEWYRKMNTTNKTLVGAHIQEHIIASRAQNVISYIKVIKDIDSFDNLGYVMIDCSTKTLEDIFGSSQDNNNNGTYILDQNNELIYESNYHVCARDKVLPLIKQYDFSSEVKFDTRSIEGQDVFLAYYASPTSDLRVVSISPLRYIYKSINTIRNFTIMIVLISILIAAITSIFISRGISKPIKILRKKMKEFESGDLETQVGSYTSDEIGELSKTFDIMVTRIGDMIKKEYQTEIVKKQAEIHALQAQINPHFLYNTLGAIDGLAEIQGCKDISEMCTTLSQLMRYNIEQGEETTIEKEIEQIKRYLFIEQKRHGDRMKYYIEVEPSVAQNKLLKLLIQPIVENAILHGVDQKRGSVHISIAIKKINEEKVEILICDTGNGISTERLEKIKEDLAVAETSYWKNKEKNRYHIGLGNVHYRIKLHYGEAFGVNIESVYQKETIVQIQLPIIEGDTR